MLSSTARSSSAPAMRRASLDPSRRVVKYCNRSLHSSSSSPCTSLVQHPTRPRHLHQQQPSCTVLVVRSHSQPFSTTPTPYSTRRSRRVHRDAIAAVNASLTGRIPAFTGSPPTATPGALRLAAKARLARSAEKPAIAKPPTFLEYEPQRNKPSSVFFWSDEANEMDRMLMKRGNYPPPLPKFKHNDNQQIAKCHPSVWMASAHHIQMMHEGYDRLAFMGDSVAGKCLSDLLVNDYYCIAGVMGALKARLVSNAQFAYFSRIYNIPCKNNENAQGDAFEALVGALYLDGKREGADVEKIIYDWLKDLFEPWLELYVNQLPVHQRDRVVSLQRAVPIGIAVATSDSPDSSQVMMAWESNIATQMIEKRGKPDSQFKLDRKFIQAAMGPEPVAIGGPMVDAVGKSSAAPKYLQEITEMEEDEEFGEEEEFMEEEEEADDIIEEDHKEPKEVSTPQDSAAVSGKAWPTVPATTPPPTEPTADKRKEFEAKRTADLERLKNADSEALRKANEDRRQREENRRKEAEELQKKLDEEKRKRVEEETRRIEEQRRQEVLKHEERLRKELMVARAEAERARKLADEEAERQRKKLEEDRPKSKAEKRAEKKAAKLEAEMIKITYKKAAMKIETDKAESERERGDKERGEKETAVREKAEKENAEKDKVEKDKAEKEKAEKDKADKEKTEKEKEKESAAAAKKPAQKDTPQVKWVPPALTPDAPPPTTTPDAPPPTTTPTTPTPTPPIPAPAPTPPKPTPRPTTKPAPLLSLEEQRAALIREKEALHLRKVRAEEEALKFERLLYDIDQMEAAVVKKREEMIALQPHMTEAQREEFARGWAQYADVQREKLEVAAGYGVGSSRKGKGGKKGEGVGEEGAETQEVEREVKREETRGVFGRLWGAMTGRK